MIHFQIQKFTEMKEFHVKEPLHIFFYIMKGISEFYNLWNCEGL